MKDLGIDYDFPGYVSYHPSLFFIHRETVTSQPTAERYLPSPLISLLASSHSPNGFNLPQFSSFCCEVQVALGPQGTGGGGWAPWNLKELFCFKAHSTMFSSSWSLALWSLELPFPLSSWVLGTRRLWR